MSQTVSSPIQNNIILAPSFTRIIEFYPGNAFPSLLLTGISYPAYCVYTTSEGQSQIRIATHPKFILLLYIPIQTIKPILRILRSSSSINQIDHLCSLPLLIVVYILLNIECTQHYAVKPTSA
jgi:hypothetical protein